MGSQPEAIDPPIAEQRVAGAEDSLEWVHKPYKMKNIWNLEFFTAAICFLQKYKAKETLSIHKLVEKVHCTKKDEPHVN